MIRALARIIKEVKAPKPSPLFAGAWLGGFHSFYSGGNAAKRPLVARDMPVFSKSCGKTEQLFEKCGKTSSLYTENVVPPAPTRHRLGLRAGGLACSFCLPLPLPAEQARSLPRFRLRRRQPRRL